MARARSCPARQAWKRPFPYLVFTAGLTLSGCAAPLGFVVATLAIDGAALVATGKTPAEHALSAIVEQDCSVGRMVTQGDLCVEVVLSAGEAAPVQVATLPNSLSIDLAELD